MSINPVKIFAVLVGALNMMCTTSLFSNTSLDGDFANLSLVMPAKTSSRGLLLAEKIWSMDKRLGLTKSELTKACLFIERKIPQLTEKVRFSKKDHGVRCTISKAPMLKGYLISNFPHDYIGRGAHKTVRKAILYADKPKIIASCLCDESGRSEVQILRKLRNCRGIVTLYGVLRRPHNKLEVMLEFYPDGSLLSKRGKKFRFTPDQKLKIAKDVAYGLLAMHQRHLIHRDLHSGNILLRRRSNGLFDAALVDFGKAMLSTKATSRDVPQAAKSKNPPEILIRSIKKLDRYAVDVYALGSNLYTLFWNAELPWGYAFNPYKMKKMSSADRRKTYRKIVSGYIALKKKRLNSLMNRSSLTAQEQVQRLIFSMIDYNPSRRPSMDHLPNVSDFRFCQIQ